MKKNYFFTCMLSLLLLGACKTEDYDWENWSYTAVPLVTVNTAKSAFPIVSTANTAYFNLADPDLANEEFEYVLDWEGFEREEVSSIEVYLSFAGAEATPPAYPVTVSQPGGLYPRVPMFPLPSRVGSSDVLYTTVTEFPATITATAAEMAAFTGKDLATVKKNDYFIYKFIVNLADGRRIVGLQENVCDESRGEVGDCRVGVRFM